MVIWLEIGGLEGVGGWGGVDRPEGRLRGLIQISDETFKYKSARTSSLLSVRLEVFGTDFSRRYKPVVFLLDNHDLAVFYR